MSSPLVYLYFPGTAREALEFYQSVFGGEVEKYTFADFSRDDGPADYIAHSQLRGLVNLAAADAVGPELDATQPAERRDFGGHLALLGTASPEILQGWFTALADAGTVVDPMTLRPWGGTDGQVVDKFGVPWLVGFEAEE